MRLRLLLALLLGLPLTARAGTAEELIAQLRSNDAHERSAAIQGLRQSGAQGQTALKKARDTINLEPQQALLVRRLLGEPLLHSTPLKPVDLSTLIALGEDKSKNLPGNKALRYNKDHKLIAIDGCFLIENGPLELLAIARVPEARVHESALALFPLPRDICLVLLVCGYDYASKVSEDGVIDLPKDAGVMVSVEFLHEPTHAHMQPTPDATRLIWGLNDKAQALTKATAQTRELILWDMESDLAVLRSFLAVPGETDDLLKRQFLEQLHKLLEQDSEIYDDRKRESLLAKLIDYLTLENGGVKPQRQLPVLEWNKKLIRVPVEFLAWNTATQKTMRRVPFAFTGSRRARNAEGKHIFVPDVEGSVIALKFDGDAMLNTMLDTKHVDPHRAEGYDIHTEIVPQRLSRCRLILEPWSGGDLTPQDLNDTAQMTAPAAPQGSSQP